MLRLPRGLADLTMAAGGGPAAELSTLERAGLVVLPSAVSPADVAALRELSRRRVEALEARMVREGHEQGLEGGDYSYAEVCSRGKGRWDMLLHAPPSDACDVPELNFAGQAAGAEPSDEAPSGRVAGPPLPLHLPRTFSRTLPVGSAPAGGQRGTVEGCGRSGPRRRLRVAGLAPSSPLEPPRALSSPLEPSRAPSGPLGSSRALSGPLGSSQAISGRLRSRSSSRGAAAPPATGTRTEATRATRTAPTARRCRSHTPCALSCRSCRSPRRGMSAAARAAAARA